MTQEAYCSFEVAKLLEEKGFEQHKCQHSYDSKGRFKWSDDLDPYECSAPTHQMAMAWLREIHNKYCDIGYDIDLDWFFQVIDLKETVENDYPETKRYHTENDTGFNTYEKAVEAALKYTLENLI